MSETFVEKYFKGKVNIEQIDNFVKQWHNCLHKIELHDFLGLTWREYSLWVEQPNSLHLILSIKKGEKMKNIGQGFIKHTILNEKSKELDKSNITEEKFLEKIKNISNEIDQEADKIISQVEMLQYKLNNLRKIIGDDNLINNCYNCGAEAKETVIGYKYQIVCKSCGLNGPIKSSINNAIKIWNNMNIINE